MTAYLQMWTEGLEGARALEGQPLEHGASNQYEKMHVGVGDRLYVVYLDGGRLHALGTIDVEEVLDQRTAEARWGRDIWKAATHVVGGGVPARFDLRLPEDVVRQLRFDRASGSSTALTLDAEGRVNGQALQSVRRLSGDSAGLIDEVLAAEVPPDGKHRSPGGPTPAPTDQRRAVELHAMAVVTAHYEADGWSVDDVSASRPYDLVCTRNDERRHVEVKGLSGPPTRVGLTRNEVEHARSCQHVVLAVVSDIQVATRGLRASGGRLQLSDPWRLDASRLQALAYSYGLDPLA